ncbi:precorrin-4 C(11)-methyltransferase [Lachnobacterium bovis]|uniref:Precorrin-4/cobalt-precorrin-4 C11-methyltransferase n=1 Tax=Lachnobacterium bovis TaxID=140626 RepID=A0A1H9QBA1_9FIRM|nr:precorrin-4 C(11)-methyltransferase [Lachnobacterium bovis]SER57113.1 precorrin-4/cobalt-precorrin-4 C11-methyltransferase [Lachnobacterium bovis]
MIHFVGAGTGAVDLITVRGMNILKKADIIIYAGSLVNKELLQYKKEDCIVYNSATMTLDEVIEVMELAEKEKKDVARVHTGDPCIYGAVREQMDELDKRGILYDSCPGVSACFGAAASMNVEYTLPNVSQSLIITRMEGKTKVPEKESIQSFASHNATMAIYLSIGMVKELSKRLIQGGYSPSTPAAIAYKVTWPDEKIFKCTVETLDEVARENNITKTALVIVGDVLEHFEYQKSRLYAPDFSTEYRKAKE